MKAEKIGNYLAVASTTALGVLGALTGNPALQAIAFLPTVASTLYSEMSNDKGIRNDLEDLLKETCTSVRDNLSFGNSEKTDFFRYSYARVEMDVKKIEHLSDITTVIRKDLEIEKRLQGIYLTKEDVQMVAELFANEFISGLSKYPALESYLVTSSIMDHEKRIADLEKVQVSAAHDDTLSTGNISDDTQYYYKKFTEPLFLHRRLPSKETVSLQNVYTLPKAETMGQWRKIVRKSSYHSIKDAINQFLNYHPTEPGNYPYDILFIEGQAAMGKSSLIAWLCWHYKYQHTFAKELIGSHRLITIKMRDISPRGGVHGVLDLQQPFAQIYAYLLKQDVNTLIQRSDWKDDCINIFKNTILVLEGFDELCMIENLFEQGKSTYLQNLSNELTRMDCGCKIIITTRPSYINVERLDFPKAYLSICPFTVKERKKWLAKYEKKYPVCDGIKEMLLRNDISILDGIIDSPLTLYMIVARSVHLSETSSLWDIYHQIFAEEIYQRGYERGSPHEINCYRESLYCLTAEIANAVSTEEHLFITTDKLLNIQQVRTLLDNLDGLDENKQPNMSRLKDILEECFGLASYFRILDRTDANGKLKCAVEFYHNNIKDYFCCEYIWMNLERIYSQIPSNPIEMEKWFIRNFQNMFQYATFLKDSSFGERAMSIRFLESKIFYLKEHGKRTDFICQEMRNHYLKRFFGKMLQTGMLYHYEYTGNENIIDMMTCIYSAVLGVYHTIYLPYLIKDERISITEEEYTVDISTSFIYRILFPMANIYTQSYIKFDGIMFSGIVFGRHDFRHSSFRRCLLVRCDFKDCDLRGVDFTSASLQHADLSGAIIDKTTKFSYAEFKLTKISRAQREFLGKRSEGELLIID